MPEPSAGDEHGVRRVRGGRDRVPRPDRRTAVRLVRRPAPARQRRCRPARWRRPASRSRSSTCCAGCARGTPAAPSLRGGGPGGPDRRVRRRPRDHAAQRLPELAGGLSAHPQVHGAARRSAAGRSARCTRCTTTWRTRTGRSRSWTGTRTRWSRGLSRSTRSLLRLPPHPNVVEGGERRLPRRRRTCPTWSSSTWTARTSATWSRSGYSDPPTPSGSASTWRPALTFLHEHGVYPLRHQAEQPAVDRPRLQDHRLQRGRAAESSLSRAGGTAKYAPPDTEPRRAADRSLT